MKFVTSSPEQTIKLGQKLAKQLKGGEVICLYGNLGAGKTTLIKGIAQGLGIKKIITSPTFVLMKTYQVTRDRRQETGKQNKILVHIDCYRINSEIDIINIGAQEYFSRPDTITVIEWPERIKKILPRGRTEIKIKIGKTNQRIFNIL